MAELSQLQKDYRKFFAGLLDRYDVESPADLTDEQKKDFFDNINKNWTSGEGQKKDPKDIDIKEENIDESPVGSRGRTSRKEALEFIAGNPQLIKELKTIIKKSGGKEVFKNVVSMVFDKNIHDQRLGQSDLEVMKQKKIELVLRGNFA
jgi:hypothetical protein